MSIDICCCEYTVFSIVTHVLLTSNTYTLTNSPNCVPSGITDRSTAVAGLFAGGEEEPQVEDDRFTG